ncbi:hypothetical protein [Dichelobacter nodosus]|uniref:hypothetical protein n=1 Tax=Dichelobacter nodosus TaxID=870 RepID=UPI0011D15BB9|nr:hypothetical protein [Dichelobacter nodosus]
MKKISLSLLVFCLGCQPDIYRYRAPCPVPPTLPKIRAAELRLLSDETYHNLVERELRLKEYIELLKVNCGNEL